MEWLLAIGLGAATGVLSVFSRRAPLLGWLMMAPIAVVTYLYQPLAAAAAGAVAGAIYAIPSTRPLPAPLNFVISGVDAVFWAIVIGLAAWAWPQGVPAWGALVMPVAAFALTAGPRYSAPPGYGGSARLADAFLTSQQPWLPVVHIARLGSDLVIAPLLTLAATIPVMLLVSLPPATVTVVVAAASAILISVALGFGFRSYRRADSQVRSGQTLRVAAISIDDPLNGTAKSPAYRDVEARIAKYQPLVTQAIEQSARLIALPECAVIVTPSTRGRWLSALSEWAKQGKAVIVAGLFDDKLQSGQVVIVDESGAMACTYDKQHPVAFAEPKRRLRMPPAVFRGDSFIVSAIICYDMDFTDYVWPIKRAGGVLVIPANDFKGIEDMHARSAVWTAVMTGVPVVRPTGHGNSVVFDAAGHMLCCAESLAGPVLLVSDMPIGMQARMSEKKAVTATAA